jgi:hypothetical protein
MSKYKKLSKKDLALQDKENKTYKIHIKPCAPFSGSEGDGEVIEITTDRLGWSMKEFQRNRAPLLWDVKSSKTPI